MFRSVTNTLRLFENIFISQSEYFVTETNLVLAKNPANDATIAVTVDRQNIYVICSGVVNRFDAIAAAFRWQVHDRSFVAFNDSVP